MDSGNSGSIQSSSGGGGGDDQEYDSPTYFNPPPAPQSPHHHNSNSPISFDPNSLLNFDPIWSKTQRFDQNCIETHPLLTSPSPIQPFFQPSFSPPVCFPPLLSENNSTVTTTNPRISTDQELGARSNPKKRSRASRRAPTTVLTTDTTNFRAMVQEFTGIPQPPFSSSSSPFNRSNPLDLFTTPSSIRSNTLLTRPFAHKIQPTPPLPQFLSHPPATSINFPMKNPINIFDPRKTPLASLSNRSFDVIPANDTSHLKMSVFDEFGLGHGLPNQTNLFSLDRSERISMGLAGDEVGPNSTDESPLRTVSGSYEYSQQDINVTGNLVNFSTSSDFQ